jgi:hypothetical protein
MRPETPGEGYKFVNISDGLKRDEIWDGDGWIPVCQITPFSQASLYRRRIPEPVKPANPDDMASYRALCTVICRHLNTPAAMSLEHYNIAHKFWSAGVTWAKGDK